jgi:ketosteroid isomerase-like protein
VGLPNQENSMTAKEIVDRYYDAWINRAGDFSEVPLAENFAFIGPVASFDSAEGYRQMASEAGKLVTRFEVRHQFVDGDRVCSIIDWEMSLPVAPMTSAEVLEVRDGKIVRGELIYDAAELRAAMAQSG